MATPKLIVDIGSGLSKVGYAGTDIPTFLFPSIVGKTRRTVSPRSALSTGDAFVGLDVYKRRGDLSIQRPVQAGIVNCWDDYELLLLAILHQHLQAKETPEMILTESPVTPTSTRERTAETVFEMFSAPSVAFASQTTLSLINSLYGPAALRSARIPRVVVESGYGATHVVPYAANGLPIENAIQSSYDLVGSVLDVQLKLLLSSSHELSTSSLDIRQFEAIKHKHCYIAEDYMLELAKYASGSSTGRERKETLGQHVVHLSEERFACPEALFRPELLQFAISQDTQRVGLPQLIMKAINAALDDYDTAASSDSDDNMDADDHNNHFNDENDTSSFRSLSSSSSSWSAQSRQHRKQIMLENIYLSGGNTMFPGLIPRLTHELELCSYASSTDSPPFPPAMNTHAHAMKASVSGAPDRAYGAWCGAAMLLSVEQDYLLPFTVTKENYDEFGPSIVNTVRIK